MIFMFNKTLPFLQGTTVPSGTAFMSNGSLPPCFLKTYIHPVKMSLFLITVQPPLSSLTLNYPDP